MAETRKRKAASRPGAGRTAPVVTTEIVVRRGALRRFDALKRKTADLPVVITWDRRQTNRRETPGDVREDRRSSDRRQKPPFTWELAEFVVVAPRPALPVRKAAPKPKETRPAGRRIR